MDTTRWAMVGTGLMLQLIGRDLGLTENVEPRVIVSRTQERADEAAKEFGFAEGSADFEAVLERDDIDVMYIATPHSLHFEQAMAALSAGKHVLVEKAMTTNAARTRDLCSFAQSRGLFAMEAMWMAFNPAIVEMRRRVAEGQIGEVQSVQATFAFAVPYRADHRLWAQNLAGGSTLDQGVYTLSLAQMMLGTPTSVTARGTLIEGVDADVLTTLDYGSGKYAVCSNGLVSWSPCSAFVSGSTGCFEIPGAFWSADRFLQRMPGQGPIGPVEEFTYEREGMGYVPMLRAVSAAILNGQTQLDQRTHADSIAVAETMDEVLRQVHTGAG
jgi:predicted dehydrogenase